MKEKFLKVTLLVVLVLALTAALSACGSKSKETATPAPSAKTEATKAPATKAPTAVPTVAPTAVPTVAPTAVPTVAPTVKPQPTAGEIALEEVDASSSKIKAALDKLDSYQFDVTTKSIVILKDGSEKVISIKVTTIVVNKPKAASKFTMHAEGDSQDLAQMNGFEAISVGDTAWIKMGADASWTSMPAGTVQQMTSSFSEMSSGVSDIAFAEKRFRKGTKRIGPLKCTVYEYTKKDILSLAKKYPKEITEADVAELEKWTNQKSTVCLTKDGLPLMFSMEVSGPPAAMGMDSESVQSMFGIQLTDIKEVKVSFLEEASNINKKFDIKPPKTGG